MNRFTEILNESKSFTDLESYILPITDIIGKHNVATLNFGEEVGYVFRWNLGFNINQYNGTKEVNDILKVFECLQDVAEAMERLKSYIVDFKFDDTSLSVRMTPKSESEGQDYKFIVGQNWRNIILDYAQIVKFFRDRGFSVRSARIKDNEYNETSDVTIITDADMIAIGEFESMFNKEVDVLYNEEESLNRSVTCDVNGSNIYIYPDEEETYVIFNQQV
jgi:hypothetical protein